jgi:hypothetical protein
MAAAFSPDGSKVLYAYRDLQSFTDTLAVRNIESGSSECVLLAEIENGAATPDPYRGLFGIQWAANDRVMVITGDSRGAILFTLR